MRKIFVFAMLFVSISSAARETYWTTSFGNFIFSYSPIESSVFKITPKVRFTAWLHFSQYRHTDFNKHIGMFSGSSIRNVGLIYEFKKGDIDYKVKQRAYMFGLPLAVKFGNLPESRYVYVGGEIEAAFHYKEKYFKNSVKESIFTEWFSPRTNILQPSVFVGWQSGETWNICAKWYLLDFLNTDYTREGTSPVDYSTFKNSQIFYISISTHIKTKKLKLDDDKKDPKFAMR